MEKIYLLLRNNIQSGPFTLTELANSAICSDDLVWILGKSNTWCYVDEIVELRLLNNSSSVSVPANSISITPPVKTNSPRIFVSLPSHNNTLIKESVEPDEPNFEERIERVKQKITAAQETKHVDAELNINYSRPLDEIKAEYADWLQAQRKSRRVKALPFLLVALLIVFAAVFGYNGIESLMLDSANQTLTSQKLQEPAKQVRATVVSESQKSMPVTESQDKQQIAVNPVPEKQKPGFVKKQQPQKPLQTKPSVKENTPNIHQSGNEVQKAAPATPSIASQISLKAEYINTDQVPGLGGMSVTFTNSSQQFLKLVAVDVIYYEDLDHELMRKTLYFTDVKPGEILKRTAPAHKKAKGAYARLGLISSESGNLFYAKN
jgi:hypothetical protein